MNPLSNSFGDEIPPYTPSSIDEISSSVEKLRLYFNRGSTRSYSWRIKQLNTLLRLITDNQSLLAEALHKDLGKCSIEAALTEVTVTALECKEAISKLRSWMVSLLSIYEYGVFMSTINLRDIL